MVQSAVQFLKQFDRILNSLVVSPERAPEEVDSDWTASHQLVDVLMSMYKLLFRVRQHFSSEVVTYAKANNIKPSEFPYADAQKIYRESVMEYSAGAGLPLSETEFRSTLNPVAIVQNRRTVGGP